MIKKFLLPLILLFIGTNYMFADAKSVDGIEKELNRKLASAHSLKDSISLLYNLFDVVPNKEKSPYARKLYNLAKNNGRTDIQLDLLRQLSQLGNSLGNRDSVFVALNDEVAKIPRNQEQEETALFIRMRQVSGEAKQSDQKKIENRIVQLIAQESKAKDLAINLRVLRLFTIVEYLSTSGVEGELLGEYVEMLKERMSQANFQLRSLNNILLTESANIFTTIGNPEEAVKADKEMLKAIEALEEKYHSEGRIYRNYTPSKYLIYRRMLGNYPALTSAEVKEYYRKIKQYEAEDEDVQAIEGESHQALMAYSMATKDYVTALPLIKSTLATTNQPAKRRKLLRWMQIAAEGIGDKDTQIAALRMYNDMLVDRDTSSSSDRAKELDIRTRVSELKADNVHLQIEKEKEEKESYQRIMTFVMVGWILFALLLFGILVIWARYRAASVKIGQFVDNLDAECVYLKDQHYRDYLHSKEEKSIDLLNRKRIERRKRKRSILDKLNYILNDLLYIASIGKIGRGKFVRPVSVIEVIDDESSIAMANQASDVELDIVYPVKDIEMRTDKECLEYVLHHLFYAANRVAEGGKICLEVKESEDGRKVDFIFTNSSVFVPEGNEDVMFDNFIDLSKLTDRDDAGLFIARLSALLINSSLYLDRGFNDGSRYIFSTSKVMGKG